MKIIEGTISSHLGAVSIARELKKNENGMRLDPCDRPEGKRDSCQFKDQSAKMLCLQPDGLLAIEGTIFCPLQRGKLQVVPKIARQV